MQCALILYIGIRRVEIEGVSTQCLGPRKGEVFNVDLFDHPLGSGNTAVDYLCQHGSYLGASVYIRRNIIKAFFRCSNVASTSLLR